MKITSKVTWDILTGEILELEQFDWDGPVALCKVTDTANEQRKQELQMQQQAFNTQQKQIADLKTAFSGYLQGNKGFDPATMAAMRSQFLNSNNNTFNQAGNMVRSALGARGEGTGSNPVGGNYATGLANLLGAKAGSQSQGLLGLDVTNAQQALTNQFNAGNLLSGNAATLTGTQGVAGSGASSALNSYITASNSGFTGSFSNAFGGALGKSLGSFGMQTGPSGTTASWGA